MNAFKCIKCGLINKAGESDACRRCGWQYTDSPEQPQAQEPLPQESYTPPPQPYQHPPYPMQPSLPQQPYPQQLYPPPTLQQPKAPLTGAKIVLYVMAGLAGFALLCFGACVVLIAIGTNHTASNPSSSQSAQSASSTPDLKLIEENWCQKSSLPSFDICGTVKNNTAKQYRYVKIEFTLYDKSDAQIGTAWAIISNLEPNGTWKFKALVLQEETARYKLQSLTGY